MSPEEVTEKLRGLAWGHPVKIKLTPGVGAWSGGIAIAEQGRWIPAIVARDGYVRTPTGGMYFREVIQEVIVADVEWPPEPVPNEPGVVLMATVRGVPGIKIMRCNRFTTDSANWVSSTVVAGTRWHNNHDITDWTRVP